ncbi:class I SAM-dependent methyltransferase [Actinokineospora iranica]|uniref:hypothetical protein n=1 Tax=Actinokineospora iranica TaxID=1271860 RepID=UPI001E44996E|nr:hypothetical protein [Actinokineospora iranica]
MVVVAGEDSTDRKCLRILLEAFCPSMAGRIVEINDAVRLRQAGDAALAARVDSLANKVRARAAREDAEVACVFVHEDFDACDSDHFPIVRDRVQRALDQRFGNAHYTLAVWEIEAWLLLFPGALHSLVSGWKVPKQLQGKDTGRLNDPKRVLKTQLGKARAYRETDAPDVIEKAVDLGAHTAPLGTNRSWDLLRGDVQTCCAQHLGSR